MINSVFYYDQCFLWRKIPMNRLNGYLFAICVCLVSAIYAMETKFEKQEISNNNAIEAKPDETLVERLSQQYTPEYVANIKQEFNAAQYPEKFSFYEKFIAARLGKISRLIKNNSHQYSNLALVLRELIQTDEFNKQEQNKIASSFIKELTTTKKPTYNELVAPTPSDRKAALIHNLSSITSLVLSTNNKTLFSGSTNGSITVWDVSDPAKPTYLANFLTSLDKTKTGRTKVINCLAISPDNKTLFSGSDNETIKIWSIVNPANATLLATIKNIDPLSLCVSSDNEKLFCGSRGGAITIYDITNLTNPTLIGARRQAPIDKISSLVLSTDNKTLFSGSQDRTFRIWNVSNPRNITAIKLDEVYDLVSDLVLSSDNKTLFVGLNNGSAQAWDITNANNLRLLSTVVNRGKIIGNLKIRLSSDNKTLFCLTSDQTINIWNVSNLKDPIHVTSIEPPIANRNKNTSRINLVLFNDKIIYQVCGFDNKVRQCDASFLSNICTPTLTNYFTQLPTRPEGIIEYFFIKELVNHRKQQASVDRFTPKALVITNSLLIELFNQLPKELQQELITKNYVTFAKPTYKQTATASNNNNNNK